MIDFQTLQQLSAGAPMADVACPLCGLGCKTPSNRTRKVLRIWNQQPGFATFKCQRCGESGYAHDGSERSGSDIDPIDEIIAAFKSPTVVPFKQAEPDGGKTDLARALWRRSSPARGTIVETYLRGRCCWLDTETVHYLPPRNGHLPAMIVSFGIPTEPEPGMLDITSANIHGVQLTKLKPDGSGKADVEPKKLTLGQCVGFPMVLAPPNDLLGLVVTEGVEDGLTAHLATGRGVWASGGAGRLPALADKVPAHIEQVTIVMDEDDAGRRNANELGLRLQNRGIDVELLRVPQRLGAAA